MDRESHKLFERRGTIKSGFDTSVGIGITSTCTELSKERNMQSENFLFKSNLPYKMLTL